MKAALFLMILSACVAWSCSKADTTASEGTHYKTIIVSSDTVTVKSQYAARLQGRQVVEIRPQISGLITDICIDEGQRVTKGRVLFRIDPTPYQAALDRALADMKSAEAQLATAQLKVNSMQQLHDKGIIHDYDLTAAQNEYAEAAAAVAVAKAQIVAARNDLSYTVIKSPADGVAGMISYRVGALVSSSITTPLVTVSDDSVIYAYFSLSESALAVIAAQYGSIDAFVEHAPAVRLLTADGATYPTAGRISAISGIVSGETGAVMLRADFDNAGHQLRDGGAATVVLPQTRTGCIVIPQTATYELQGKTFVYKVVNGLTQSAPVELFSINNGSEYIVEAGLAVGDTIIAEGAGLLSDGVAVSTDKAPEAQ